MFLLLLPLVPFMLLLAGALLWTMLAPYWFIVVPLALMCLSALCCEYYRAVIAPALKADRHA